MRCIHGILIISVDFTPSLLTHLHIRNGHEMKPKERIKSNNNKVMTEARDSKNGKIMSCHSKKIKS